jgi:hypothetical protein
MPERNLQASLLAIVVVALIASGIAPTDRLTWLMEVAPVLIALPLMIATRRSYPLTLLLTVLIAIHALVLFNCLLLEQDMLELEQPDSLLLHGQVNTWRIQLFAQWRRRWPLWSDPYAYFSGPVPYGIMWRTSRRWWQRHLGVSKKPAKRSG